jgi:hypothetical protein
VNNRVNPEDVSMTTTEPISAYEDVPDMFRRLKILDERGTAFARQREAIIDRTLPLAEHVARRPGITRMGAGGYLRLRAACFWTLTVATTEPMKTAEAGTSSR